MKKQRHLITFILACTFFCTDIFAQAPANDDCSTAIAVTTTAFGANCASSTIATTVNATASAALSSCALPAATADDIWYSFTASSASVIVRVANAVQVPSGNANIAMELYSGACNALTTITCFNGFAFGDGYRIIHNLIPGNTYFLRFWTVSTSNSASFNFCVQDVPPPPANDECTNAIPITTQPFGITCSSSVTANTAGATASTPNPSCTSTENNDDIWYSFVASSSSVMVRFSNVLETTNGTTGSLGFALYNSICPTGTATLACNTFIGFGNGFKIIDGLTIGNTYLLRLFSQGSNNYISFNFCVQDVPQPPANDECANAIPIATQPFGTTCTASIAANTTGATASTPNPSCTSTENNDDIWYSFTADSSSVILRFSNVQETTNGTTGSLGFALYNSSCTAGTATFACNTFIGFGSGHKIIDGLTIGNTYLLRLFSQSANNYISFNFCVQDVPAPPPNDECANAIPITTQPFGTACTAAVTVNTTGATASAPNPSCTSTDNNDDVWYSFTANSASVIVRFSNIIETTNGNTGSLAYALYNATCPASTSTFSCSTFIGFGDGFKIIDGLTIGNTYLLRMFSQSANNYISFNFCVQDVPPPPVNDDCTNAIPVTLTLPGSICLSTISANTTGATASANSPSCATSNNDDIWYSFTASGPAIILRYSNCFETTTATGSGIGYALYNNCPGGTATLMCSNSFGFINSFASLTGLTAGNNYLLRLYSAGTNNYASFNFCLQSPLVNDECSNAIDLPVTNGFCNNPVLASLNGATTSAGFAAPDCRPAGPSRDVWFKTTVPPTGNLIIQTSAVKLSGNNLVMTAYGGSCGVLTQISCDDDGNPEPAAPSANHSRISLSGRTAGETITIRITAGTTSNEEQFAICAWDTSASVLPSISTVGNCVPSAPVQIDSSKGNIFMWVPVFDINGHIIAEINSDGNNLGNISPQTFVNTTGTVRNLNGKFYLDRNIALTAASNQPAKIRLYISSAELNALKAVDPSILSAADLRVLTTEGNCQPALIGTATAIPRDADANYGSNLFLQFSATSFSNFFIDGNLSVVPVQLSLYTAVCNNNQTTISWTTTTEINSRVFTVERSRNGITYETLAVVQSAAATGNGSHYQVTDLHPFDGNNYYRLKQTDADGREKYFNTLVSNCSRGMKYAAIYPNPVLDKLYLQLNGHFKNPAVKISSATGIVVYEKKIALQQVNNIAINTQQFPAGVYILRLADEGNKEQVLKFVKQ